MDGFTAWLVRHVTDQDALGELTRRAAADPDWPEEPDRLERFTAHLERPCHSSGTAGPHARLGPLRLPLTGPS